MNRIILLIFCLFASSSILHSENQNNKYVIANSGLNMRLDANLDSKVIKIIPFGAKVEIKEISRLSLIIDGVKGNWVNVDYLNNKGWVFDAYLTDVLDDKIELSHYIFLENVKQMAIDDKYVFLDKTFSVIDIYNGYYTIRYDFIQKGALPSDLTRYEVLIKKNNNWEKIYSAFTWGFSKLLVRNINNDNIPDLIRWDGGCCGSSEIINVFLGLNNNRFDKKQIDRNPPDKDSSYHTEDIYENEKFIYDSPCGNNYIIGYNIDPVTKTKNKYVYKYDCESNTFIKIDSK